MDRKIQHRCFWVNMKNPAYIHYHDTEWGVPLHTDKKLFEFLLLETFQAGLSWECILNKREAFQRAFDGFDYHAISQYTEEKITELLQDPGIIRNRLKVRAAIENAKVFIQIQEEYGSFDAYIWGFTKGKVIDEPCDLRITSPLSDQVSMDLKQKGMKFVGSTTIYSYLQAIGVINGHMPGCDCYPKNK